MNKKLLACGLGLGLVFSFSGCQDDDDVTQPLPIVEDPSRFSEVGSLTLTGGTGAAEISAYDPDTKRLFVVNNAGNSRVDVINLEKPSTPVFMQSIDITAYGGGVNSVAVKNGKLAAAVEAKVKQNAGKVVIFDTKTFTLVKEVNVGSLPDMVTFSPDGKYILSANEGEPNSTYTVDPNGSVSIITVDNNYSASTVDFTSFNNSKADLEAKGLRVFGPNATLAMDIEPEYITVSEDSKTAWVTLQENNAIAKVDIASKTIQSVTPLGFKDYSIAGNEIDVSDEDKAITMAKWPIKGLYLPDALAAFTVNGTQYLITANEGDTREYDAFVEEERIRKLNLDPVAFPNAAELKANAALGRLKVTKTMGDTDKDGDYDQLYSFGARSFSIWNGSNGSLVFDSGNDLEKRLGEISQYPDDRSDDKGIEPEGVTVAVMNNRTIAFVGSERADAVLIYDVSNPSQPKFLQILKTGDAPEGIIFIPADKSPTQKSLLVVSSEEDGVIKVFEAATVS